MINIADHNPAWPASARSVTLAVHHIAQNRDRQGAGKWNPHPACSALLVMLAAVAAAQAPAFEAATVKPAPLTGDRGTNINTTADTITLHNATLKFCIQAAYSIPADRVFGGPDWAATQRFEVTGKSSYSVAPTQLLLMLRSLLAERFQLHLHTEQREVPIYALVSAKSAAKLTPSDPNDQSPPSLLGRAGAITAHKTTMADLAATLSLMGRPVSDRSGLTGTYDFTLEGFAPLNATPGDARPSLFTAIEEQLGLRLEAARGPVDVLVIDQAAPPSEN